MRKLYTTLVAILVMGIGIAQAQLTRVNEDFDVTMVPAGWANALNGGPILARVTTVQSFGRPGTTAAIRANYFNDPALGGSRATLETNVFNSSVTGDSLRFDVAHATYTGGEQDSLIVLAFDGTSYNRIAAWASSPTIDLAGITTAPAQTAEFIPTSGQWLTKKIQLPIGTTRVQFEFYSDYGNQLYIDKVLVDSSVAQVYTSSTATQTNTSPILLGATNQEIIGMQVVVNGNNPVLPLTNILLHTGATTNPASDIVTAKVYYTGNSASYSTANLFGSVSGPNGAFNVSGSVNLMHGTNYFWLAYDISATASNGNAIDARCDSFRINAITRIPTVQDPAGSRTISAPNQVVVNATAGMATATYATLKEGFDKINDGTHQGDITITIANSTIETSTALLRRSGTGAASYTKVYIAPSATVSVTGNITGSLVHLKGASNVTIDGRVGMAGNNRLSFTNQNTATNTAAIHISSMGSGLGAVYDTISYCNIRCGGNLNALNTFGIYIADSTISNAATGLNNNYNAVIGNKIENCRYGIYNRGNATSTATYNKSIFISGNTLGSLVDSLTISFVGIDCRNNDSLVISKNNIIGMVEAGQTAILRAIELGGNIVNSKIDANFIDNIRNTTTTLFRSGQGIFIATVAASNTVISNNVIQNLNGHGSGTLTNNVWGIFVNTGGGIKILFNTISLTGVATATGSADRSGCLLLNSAASTAIEVRGNIFFNTRFPGSNTTGLSEGVHSLTTAANLTINNNIYYVTPGSVRYIVGVIGAVDRASFAAWQTGTTQDLNSLNVNPVIATTSGGRGKMGAGSPAIGAGPTGSVVLTDMTGTTRGLTPSIGAYENPELYKDMQPLFIYTLGKLPIPYANPHSLRVSIFNWGNDNTPGSKIYIKVNGANTILDSMLMPTIGPGTSSTIDLVPYSYTNTGVDTLTVIVESDSNNVNNSKSLIQVINTNTYSYAEPFRPADGGVGFNGGTGDFVAKFPYSGSNNINQIGVNFSVGGQTLSLGIWDTSATGTPGVNLWTSAPFTTVAGLNTIVVNPPIPITGTFFVGVRQTGTVNASFSFQNENPIRPQTFYYTSPTGSTTWTDFAPNSPFRFMIEPRLQDANDIGVESITHPCLNVVQGSPAFNPIVKVFNYGANPQSAFIVKTEITGPVNYTSSDTFSVGALPSSASVDVSLAMTFNPNTIGTYTMKSWTQLIGGDAQTNNDTANYVFTVSNINGFTNAGNQITLDGTTQYGVVNSSNTLNGINDQLTIEGWINSSSSGIRNIISKDSTATVPQYDLYLNATGNLVFKTQTINGLDSVVSTSTIPLLSYTHVAVVYNGTLGQATLYANGQEIGTKTIFGNPIQNVKPLYIGRGFNNTGGFFGGNIDELRIWDTCRTADQIRMNLHTRLANFAHPNLRAYWRMDDGAGTSIADASGNCNAAALIAAPLFATSTLSLGAPTIVKQSVNISGATNFAGSNVSMNLYNQVGDNDFYVHRFTGNPVGTQPLGVTALSPNTWVVYRYGTGTMDSAEVNFLTHGVNLTAVPEDFYLFTRSVGSNANWLIVDTANFVTSATGQVTFGVMSAEFMSQFSVGANNNPLPVSLLYFNATSNQVDVSLRWATASESDNAGFRIERSIDGKTFSEIAFVKGKGNSNVQTNYAQPDKNAFAVCGVSKLYYRLVQTDFNGKRTVSNTVMVESSKGKENAISIYPNPFNNEIAIDIDAVHSANTMISVVDITGKTVLDLSSFLNKGINTIQTEGLGSLRNGVYFIRVNVDGEISTHKLIKQ